MIRFGLFQNLGFDSRFARIFLLIESYDPRIIWFDWHWLYPPKRDAAYIQYVSNCLYFYIILVRKHIWHFQNIPLGEAFLKPWKFFIPGRDTGSISKGGPMVFTYVLFWLGNDFNTSKIKPLRWPFFFLEIGLTPEWSCESRTEGGPIVFTYVLSPEGTLQSREPKEVQ